MIVNKVAYGAGTDDPPDESEPENTPPGAGEITNTRQPGTMETATRATFPYPRRDGWDDIVLRGGRGDDEVHGGAGNDTLCGGRGDDELYGGKGNDTMESGWGPIPCRRRGRARPCHRNPQPGGISEHRCRNGGSPDRPPVLSIASNTEPLPFLF